MQREEVEELVAKRITEAKLEQSEGRLQFTLWIAGAALAMFAVLLPLVLTFRSADQAASAIAEMKEDVRSTLQTFKDESKSSSETFERSEEKLRSDLKDQSAALGRQGDALSEKIDREIQEMQVEFKELAGAQLRHPIIECSVNGRTLQGAVVAIQPNGAMYLELRNSGDAPARNVRLRIYLATDQPIELYGSQTWNPTNSSDEPTFTMASQTEPGQITLDGKESQIIEIQASPQGGSTKDLPAILKIFYEQPEPMRYSFTIRVSGAK